MTKRLIPERTVDSLLAAELVLALPDALIWSPSNTAGMWDHQVISQFARLIIFECKGVVSNAAASPSAPSFAPIDLPQLNNYVASGVGVTYLLASRPHDLRVPWRRPCNDGRADGMCSACYTAVGTAPRRWADSMRHVRTAKTYLRLQPWFNHWAWCLPAEALQKHLGTSVRVSLKDQDVASIAGAVRLCHLLEDLLASGNEVPGAGALSENFVLDGEDARLVVESGAEGNEDAYLLEQTPPVVLSGI